MAGGRSHKASKPGNKRVSKKGAGATARKRTVVLDGTFSIEEVEVKSTSRRKAENTTKKKAGKKLGKKAGRKVARTAKRAAKPKTSKKPATAELGPVVLVSSPGIKNVAELKYTLAAAHSAGSAVVVDASEVESIDTAALQLLVAFANAMREQSRTVEWKEPSTVFREMADLADLSQRLGIVEGSISKEDDGLCPVF